MTGHRDMRELFEKTDRPVFMKMTGADEATLDKMTRWMYSWWGENEGYSLEAVRSALSHSMQEDRLPQTYGLFLDGEIIGMYQFIYDDLWARPDIYPWLANVYMDEKYRGRGYGRLLMSKIRETAENTGFGEVYLYTEFEGLYEKLGWEFLSEIDTFIEDRRVQRLYRLKIY